MTINTKARKQLQHYENNKDLIDAIEAKLNAGETNIQKIANDLGYNEKYTTIHDYVSRIKEGYYTELRGLSVDSTNNDVDWGEYFTSKKWLEIASWYRYKFNGLSDADIEDALQESMIYIAQNYNEECSDDNNNLNKYASMITGNTFLKTYSKLRWRGDNETLLDDDGWEYVENNFMSTNVKSELYKNIEYTLKYELEKHPEIYLTGNVLIDIEIFLALCGEVSRREISEMFNVTDNKVRAFKEKLTKLLRGEYKAEDFYHN